MSVFNKLRKQEEELRILRKENKGYSLALKHAHEEIKYLRAERAEREEGKKPAEPEEVAVPEDPLEEVAVPEVAEPEDPLEEMVTNIMAAFPWHNCEFVRRFLIKNGMPEEKENLHEVCRIISDYTEEGVKKFMDEHDRGVHADADHEEVAVPEDSLEEMVDSVAVACDAMEFKYNQHGKTTKQFIRLFLKHNGVHGQSDETKKQICINLLLEGVHDAKVKDLCDRPV